MPDTEPVADNTVQVTPLQPAADHAAAWQAQHLAVAELLVTAVRPEAGRSIAGIPDYSINPAPIEDGLIYPTTDGTPFYRPVLRVATRPPGLLAGPDVWFHRDNQGAIRLQWTLSDAPPAGAPDAAVPLPITVTAARLVWNGGSRVFDPPALEPVAGTGLAPRLLVHGGAALLPQEATALEAAMCDSSSGCRLELDCSLRFQADLVVTADGVEHAVEGLLTFTRVVPFVFNPNDEPNRPIYRALHGVANLTDQWRQSAAGWLRDSGFPNTVYRIPDQLRLAFDPNLGTPHVVTTLHTDDSGASAVRVLLRLAPWQDPRQLMRVRELVGAPGAQVVVGPVAGARLRLGGSFPENIRILGEPGEVAVSLGGGADLLLDLSLEYFQLLCGMLGGPVGLPGQVDVTLEPDAAEPVTVPVVLRMDTVDDLPVGIEVLTGGGHSPTAVRVVNRSRTAVRIGGCDAVFLQLGPGSVVPLGAHRARCTSPFPLELAIDGSAELAFEPVDAQPQAWWNAILVELLDKSMTEDAAAILLRTNRLAATGELTWDLTVSCPVFAAPAPPPRWAELAAIEVEVSAPGFDTTIVVLRGDSASRTITMRKPLAELVSGGASGIRGVSYRVRNNYLDRQGQWTQPQQQSGEELIVYPNPAAGD